MDLSTKYTKAIGVLLSGAVASSTASVTVYVNKMGDFPTGHTKQTKEMVRKRTDSGMSKAKETGVLCNTFIAYVFWNPTYRELQGVGHLPDGMDMPDVNAFVCLELLVTRPIINML
jgi:hypothetical protein